MQVRAYYVYKNTFLKENNKGFTDWMSKVWVDSILMWKGNQERVLYYFCNFSINRLTPKWKHLFLSKQTNKQINENTREGNLPALETRGNWQHCNNLA